MMAQKDVSNQSGSEPVTTSSDDALDDDAGALEFDSHRFFEVG